MYGLGAIHTVQGHLGGMAQVVTRVYRFPLQPLHTARTQQGAEAEQALPEDKSPHSLP